LPVENAGLAKGNRILSSRWRQFRGGAANNHGQGAATANIVETVTMVRTKLGRCAAPSAVRRFPVRRRKASAG
jgi:hypothetical protein